MRISELKSIIEDVYFEVLTELNRKKYTHSYMNESLIDEIENEPKPEEPGDPSAPAITELQDATEQILAKFPTLRKTIIKLQTEDFKEFVNSIDWISPRPTSFRINLMNGQEYILKWTGKAFQAEILGKRYLLSNITDYQQALDKLAILYKEAPMTGAGEEELASGEEIGQADTSGGEFPGGEAGGEAEPEFGGETSPEGGEEGGQDLTGEPIDFETGESGTEA